VIGSGITELATLIDNTAPASTMVPLPEPTAPPALSEPKLSVPDRSSIAPVNVLLPLKTRIWTPSLMTPPLPWITPEIVTIPGNGGNIPPPGLPPLIVAVSVCPLRSIWPAN
jgi:hypothetical protein